MSSILDKFVTRFEFETDRSGLGNLESAISGARSKLDSLSRNAALIGGVLTAAGGLVGRTLHGFEQQFNILASTYLDAPSKAIASLRAQAKDLGSTTSKSASEVVDAQTSLARSASASSKSSRERPPS